MALVRKETSALNVAIHCGIQCDNCGISPIRGARFKCRQCVDYDLCQDCKNKGIHGMHYTERLSGTVSAVQGGAQGSVTVTVRERETSFKYSNK